VSKKHGQGNDFPWNCRSKIHQGETSGDAKGVTGNLSGGGRLYSC